VSDDPNLATAAEVASKATLIFSDLAVPPGGRTIDYEESIELLLNFEELQSLVERRHLHGLRHRRRATPAWTSIM